MAAVKKISKQNGYGEKQTVKVITVDKERRRVECAMRDGAMIWAAVWETGTVFRWPEVGEIWTVRQDTGIWRLDKIVQSPLGEEESQATSVSLANLPEGDTRIIGNNVWVKSLHIEENLTQNNVEVFNVKNYGAKGDNVVDDSLSIQSAINSAKVRGGVVFLPPGTYLISSPLTIYTQIILEGSGEQTTTIKVRDSANIDAIVGYQFSELTGTNSLGGIHDWEISNLTIDGNRSNQSSGSGKGLKVYGYRFRLHNLRIKNCRGDNLYSEWSKEPNLGLVDDRDPESFISNIRSYGARGKCIAWRGPHDSQFENIFTVATEETTRGLSFEGNGYTNQILNLHTWGKFTEYGLYCENGSGAQYIINPQLEGGTKAQAFFGDAKISLIGGQIFDGGYGVEAIGIEIGPEGYGSYIDTYWNNCAVAIKFTGNGQKSIIRGIVNGTLGDILLSGSPEADIKWEISCYGVKNNLPMPSFDSEELDEEISIPSTIRYANISGKGTIKAITPTFAGHIITLRFSSTATVKDAFPLRLAEEFKATNSSTITLACDGEEWNEICRSVN